MTVPAARPVTVSVTRLVVEASRPIGPSSWAWVSSRELHSRPKELWPAYPTEPWNGWGDWDLSWTDWQAHSALS